MTTIGSKKKTTRDRGFIESWSPSSSTLDTITQVQSVLQEYEDYLPLTVRQIFYRLVGAHGLDKTENSYNRIKELIVKMRRARIIPMNVIRDDGGAHEEVTSFESPSSFMESVQSWAESGYRRDRQEGQDVRLLVMCEAAGMAPQLARVANEYGVSVQSSGGFDSLTEKYALAEKISATFQPHIILHLGDHDPSGVHMGRALHEDVEAFVSAMGGSFDLHRVAVTPEQIFSMDLPTAPPKPTDKRSFSGFDTCQAEAIAPDMLAQILRDAIESRMDLAQFRAVLAQEEQERDALLSKLRAAA